jgi:hypothetical protein
VRELTDYFGVYSIDIDAFAALGPTVDAKTVTSPESQVQKSHIAGKCPTGTFHARLNIG